MSMSNKEIKEVAEKFIDDMEIHGKIKVIDDYDKYEETHNPKHVFWVKTGCGILRPKLAN